MIVQSESEKNLRRIARKEEKRINKLKSKLEGSDEDDSDFEVCEKFFLLLKLASKISH